MPEARIIVDSGPLVAFLVAEDRYHDWAAEQFGELQAPFFTCEPVLTETFCLVHRLDGGHERFFGLLRSGLLVVDFDLMAEQAALGGLIRKYADVPMSLADACLVRLAELHADAAVFTIDHHFRVYRKQRRRTIPTIMPPDR